MKNFSLAFALVMFLISCGSYLEKASLLTQPDSTNDNNDPPPGLNIPAGPAKAFFGAEGAGTSTVGGRNGSIIRVTNLNKSGPGSFVEAVGQDNRFVILDVCGTIDMQGATINLGSNLTIAGETSPGGLTLTNTRLMIKDQQNVIVRFLRVRKVPKDLDGVLIWNSQNVVIDHCSIAGASDETLSVTGTSENVTVSWVELGESYKAPQFHSDPNMHNYGSIFGTTEASFVDIHHSLYIHHGKRCPLVVGKTKVQSINNVIYNWANSEQKFATDVKAPALLNLVGNVYLSGVDTRSRGNAEPIRGTYYFSDNRWEDDNKVWQTDPTSFGTQQTPLGTPQFAGAPISTARASEVLGLVAEHVGAQPRDGTSKRMITELVNRTGAQGVSIQSDNNILTCYSPATDSDKDGMPDLWERSNSFNPNDASDAAKLHSSGYTNLELYTNNLALNLIAGEINPWTR